MDNKGPQSPGKRRAQSSHPENWFNTAADEIKERNRPGTWYVTHSPLVKNWRYFNSFSLKWGFRWVSVGLAQILFVPSWAGEVSVLGFILRCNSCLRGVYKDAKYRLWAKLLERPSEVTSKLHHEFMYVTDRKWKNWFRFIKLSSHSHQPTGAFQTWKRPIVTCLPMII